MKTNLPVILLRNVILLPNNDLKIEIDSEYSKNVISKAVNFHHNQVFIVSQFTNEAPSIDNLPKFGVVASISNQIVLPNGKIRLILNGIVRASVIEYLDFGNGDTLESIVKVDRFRELEENEEQILVNKLKKELDKYIEEIPYISNSIIASIEKEKELDVLTDIVAGNIITDENRKSDYLKEINPDVRVEMLLEDIYAEFESYNVEKELDMKVSQNMSDRERELILREKIRTIEEELGDIEDSDINNLNNELKNCEASPEVKERLEKEIKRYQRLSSMSPEQNQVRTYIDTVLSLPWNKYSIDREDLKEIRSILDSTHFDMDDLKTRIIEYIAVNKNTNSLRGPILCLVGPSGIGKSTLAYSVAKALNRKFEKISLGGIHDEGEIRGHRRTYLGSAPGKIISSLIKAKTANPVILLDEVDKITSDLKGDPASALLEVLDGSLNKHFMDNYLDIEFDLSKVMFILTANNIDNIPEALKDRLEIIELSGYLIEEKKEIAKTYLIPKILKEHNIKGITIPDEVITEIIENYTKESGVRELERLISKIVRKVVTDKLINNKKTTKVTIDNKKLKTYLGKPKYGLVKIANRIGSVNALAYTNLGGEVLPIESTFYKGTGKLTLTGMMGDVMKESASIALSYIKANYESFDINYDDLINNDIHIHIPLNAIKKDGPSAGVTIITSIISAFTNLEIPSNIAMTGEVTLHGDVLAVGGIKEKIVAAKRNNIDTIFIPEENRDDVIDAEDISIVYIKNYQDIFEYLKEAEK